MLIPRTVFNVSKIAAKDRTRYALDGVRLERRDGKCIATATDGKRLISATWQDEELVKDYPPVACNHQPVDDFRATIQKANRDEAHKLVPVNGITRSKPILANCAVNESDPTDIEFGATDLSTRRTIKVARGSEEDAPFCNWRDVVPRYTPGVDAVVYSVSTLLLAELLKTVVETSPGDCGPAAILTVPVDNTKPMRIDAVVPSYLPQVVAVLMPVGNNQPDGPVQHAATLVAIVKDFVRSLHEDSDLDFLEDRATKSLRDCGWTREQIAELTGEVLPESDEDGAADPDAAATDPEAELTATEQAEVASEIAVEAAAQH